MRSQKVLGRGTGQQLIISSLRLTTVCSILFFLTSPVYSQEVTFSANNEDGATIKPDPLLDTRPASILDTRPTPVLPVLDAEPAPVTVQATNRLTSELVIPLYKSGILELRKAPTRVSIGNDSIADILILRRNQVHVLGKALGSTNVVFWDDEDQIFASVNIEVTHDLAGLKKKLFQMMPSESIRLYSAQENIVLEGPVSSPSNLSAAVKVAEAYLPECISSGPASASSGGEAEANAESCDKAEVINLMSVTGSQQVMLEVKIAEISRTVSRTLDPKLFFIDFTNPTRFGATTDGVSLIDILVDNERVPFAPAGVANGASPIIGPVVQEFAPSPRSIADNGLFFSDLTGDTLFSAAIEFTKANGLTKILAEPTLTTLSGRTAEFHSGGEFPIVTSTFQGTSVIYQDFGVSVKFLPTIIGSTINLDIDIEVSEIDETRAQTIASDDGISASFAFPFLTSRSVTNTVELSNGQTLGIAGLIQDDVDEVVSKLPGLGDIPILGQLFRSQQFQSGQTELVVFVTPHLAKPIAPDKIRLPTDSFVPPSDIEFYLLGRMEALQDPEPVDRSLRFDSGFDGVTFGHDL